MHKFCFDVDADMTLRKVLIGSVLAIEGQPRTRVCLISTTHIPQEDQPPIPCVLKDVRKDRDDLVRLSDYGQPFTFPSPTAVERINPFE